MFYRGDLSPRNDSSYKYDEQVEYEKNLKNSGCYNKISTMDTMDLVDAIKDEIEYQKEFENIFDLGTDFACLEGRDDLK